MAKKAANNKKPGTAVAKQTTGKSNVPAHLASYKSEGRGTSTDAHDNIIPMGRVLQKGSQEVDKKAPQYVAGSEPGDIYIKNGSPPIIKADTGFLFQPVHYRWGYVEWLPRNKGGGGGAGFVAFHESDKKPTNTKMAPDPMNPERQIEVRKDNGNMIVETRYHSGFLIPEDDGAPMPLVLPFSGSGHSVSKSWMGMMNRKIINGVKADSWCCYYRLKAVYKTKGPNSWHLLEVSDAGEDGETMWAPTVEDLERGKELFIGMDSGAKQFNAADAADKTDNDDRV